MGTGAGVITPPSREPDRKHWSNKCKPTPTGSRLERGKREPRTDAGGGRGDPSDGGLAEKWRADLHRTGGENLCTLSLRIIGSGQPERVRVGGLACRTIWFEGACKDEDVWKTATSAA